MNETREGKPSTSSKDQMDVIAAHAAECDECRAEPLPVERLAAVLSAGTVAVDTPGLSRHVLLRLGPELERRAMAAFWRRVAVTVLLALLPLPAIVAYDAYVLWVAYAVVSNVLPTALATGLILSQAALLALLFALTYAAIPLLLAPANARLARIPG